DPEPRERVRALVEGQRAVGNRGATDAVEAVAPRDEVALEHLLGAARSVPERGRFRLDVVHRDALHLEDDLATCSETCRDEILHDLLLTVDRDRAAAGQLRHVDAMALAVPEQL